MVSQAAEEDCLVLPEPLPGELSTPSPENSTVVEKAEEPLVPKETLCGEQVLQGYHYHHRQYQAVLVEKEKPRAG